MEPKLRQAVPSDLSSLEHLQQQLVAHERQFDSGIPVEGEVDYYDIMGLIEADDIHFLVVELEDEVMGCGFGQIRKNLEWAVDEYYGHIGLMIVREGFRKQGIGRIIVDRLVAWFRDRDISLIMIQAYSGNVDAIEAYRTYGFRDFELKLRYDPD